MFTTQTLFATLFHSVSSDRIPPKPKPTFIPPKPKPKQQITIYTYNIEDYHTHF